MNRALVNSMVAGILFMGGTALAKPLPAELIMGNDRVWKGELVRRDGDWIEFSSGTSAQPIRLGASSIRQVNFEVELDVEKVSALLENREFKRAIDFLSRAIDPFVEYSDIPSNLTKYNTLLMELYYRTEQFEKSLSFSEKIAKDNRNPELQSKARVYQILALVDSGNVEKAEPLMVQYGWNHADPAKASPEELYIKAKLLAKTGEYNQAMEAVAKVIVLHSQDPEWIQPAEILAAEIYAKLGLYDSADEVCRQILILYKDTPEYDRAKELKVEIEKLRAERKLKEGLGSD